MASRPRAYSEEEIGFTTAPAEQRGITIENARAYRDQCRQAQYFKTLNEISRVLRSHLKKRILVQGQGGRHIRTGGILQYFEDLNLASSAEIGPKDFFEIASNSSQHLHDVLDVIVQRVPHVMNLKRCTNRLLDPSRWHLEMAASPVVRYDQTGMADFIIGTVRDAIDHVRFRQ